MTASDIFTTSDPLLQTWLEFQDIKPILTRGEWSTYENTPELRRLVLRYREDMDKLGFIEMKRIIQKRLERHLEDLGRAMN